VTADNDLARLTAGLDRREAIALAASEKTAAEWHFEQSRFSIDELGWVQDQSGIVLTAERDGEGSVTPAIAAHMCLNDPADALRRIGAIRKVLAVCDAIDTAALDGEWWELGKYGSFADDIREALAGIYTVPEEDA
jgi:hypothetical protein